RLTLSDVRADADHSIRLSRVVQKEPTATFYPSHVAVGAHDSILDVMIPTLVHGLSDRVQDAVTILRMNLVPERFEGSGETSRDQPMNRFECGRPLDCAGVERVLPRAHPPRGEGDLQLLDCCFDLATSRPLRLMEPRTLDCDGDSVRCEREQ